MKTGILCAITGVLLLAFGALAFLAFHYHATAVTEKGQISQLQSDNTLQATTIAGQALTFQTFNTVAANAQKQATTTTSASEGKVIEYRTILKTQEIPVCSQFVPAAIADRLYDYTDRLRSGAVSGTVSDANGSAAGPTASRALTYCQAVLWLDPLLSTIEQANNQLAAIRTEDAQRAGKVK